MPYQTLLLNTIQHWMVIDLMGQPAILVIAFLGDGGAKEQQRQNSFEPKPPYTCITQIWNKCPYFNFAFPFLNESHRILDLFL